MAELPTNANEVTILPPDKALLKKLGKIMLDNLFSPAAIEKAQETIVEAAEDIFAEGMVNFNELVLTTDLFITDPETHHALITPIISRAFAIKVQAGLADYNLAAALANSLHSRCELLGDANLTPTNVAIIKWHVYSLKQILPLRIKGSGGAAGQAIINELNQLAASIGQNSPMHVAQPHDDQK